MGWGGVGGVGVGGWVGDVKLSKRAYVMEKVGQFPGRVGRGFFDNVRGFLKFLTVLRFCSCPPTSFVCSPFVALMTS